MKRKPKFSWSVFLVITMAVIILVVVGWYFLKEFRFQTYVNQRHGFQIDYPVNWIFEENINGALVIFYSPLENQLDFFKDNINVVIQDISASPMGLAEYSETAVNQMKLVFGEQMKIHEYKDTSLGGFPAKRLVFTGPGPQSDLKYLTVWTVNRNVVYQLTYLSVASQYNHHVLKILKMIRSFHRLPAPS